MSKLHLPVAWLIVHSILVSALPAQNSSGQTEVLPTLPGEPKLRELFVPFNDLPVILGNETRRVFMTRDELAELKRQALKSPDESLPQQTALLSADYQANLESGRAIIEGEMVVEVLAEGLHALPLTFQGVGIRQATLDDQPAKLSPSDGGVIQLLVTGKGMHRLKLELTVPVSTAAAQQSLSIQLPNPPTATFRLAVPGNVELKSGAPVINRRVDDAAKVTHFDLLPTSGPMNLVMSLNNKRLRDETTVLARGVMISEVTSGYQRLHATLSMNVLHGAADEFRIQLPQDYEVTQVSTPLLTRWSMLPANEAVADSADDPASQGRILVVKLRELVTTQLVIQLRADRLQNQLDDWHIPRIKPLSVAGFASVVGVLLEEQLASEPLESENLIAIDNSILTAALPPSVLAAEPGTPKVRPLATYYAADSDYDLKTSFVRPPARIKVTSNAVLTVGDRGLDIEGNFQLTPESEKLFAIDFVMPKEWSLVKVTLADGNPLEYERHTTDAGWRVRIRLPGGLARDTVTTISYRAAVTPNGWLSDWTEQTLQLPHFELESGETTQQSGAIALRAIDDLRLQTTTASGLIVISDQEKAQYGCAHVPVDLAWRFTSEAWQGAIKITRKTPRLVGRVFSFLQITPDALVAHYELFYDVDTARTQRLQFTLPASTPIEVSIASSAGAQVKESSSQVTGDRRLWTVTLAEKQTGRLRLSVDFTQPLTETQLLDLVLPDLVTLNTEYQSGLVAVEGHSELDVTVGKHPRVVDMGELIDAEYQPGKRLLGVYSYIGDTMQVSAQAARRAIHALPTTIVERAELVSLIGTSGITQTAARYSLRTKSQYVEIQLPAGAELWSIMVDGSPALPERQDDRIVVGLPVLASNQVRDLRVVYEQASSQLAFRGSVQLSAPMLWQRAERNTDRQPVPTADLHWEAVLPLGYRLARTAGTAIVVPEDQPRGIQLNWPRNSIAFAVDETKSNVAQYADSEPSAAMETWDARAGTDFAVVPQPPADMPQVATDQKLYDLSIQEAMPQPAGPEGRVSSGSLSKSWALEGLRCLAIDLTPAKYGQSVVFNSLGVEPTLDITLINSARWSWLGAACGLALFSLLAFRGRIAHSHFRTQLRLIALSLVCVFLVPLLIGWDVEFAPIITGVIIACLAHLGVSIIALVLRRLQSHRARVPLPISSLSKPTVTSILLLVVIGAADVHAQQPEPPPAAVSSLNELAAMIDALPDKTPLAIPADAILVPYDPDHDLPKDSDALGREKILVPYETYTKLWNAAHPEEHLSTQPPAVPYAWSSAAYETTLDELDTLTIQGKFNIEVFSDQPVAVPLTIRGGVLESLLVDGRPGKVQLVQPIDQANQPPPQAAEAARPDSLKASVLLLHLNGKGSKQLAITLRMKVERRGGWRAVEGQLPSAPATGLSIKVAKPDSEVRLNGLADRAVNELEAANETIETALSVNGQVDWQWRTKLAENSVDQGLAVDSKSVFDIQEDGLHFVWQGNFEFRSGRRESFSILVPGDYLVEKVIGGNIRGWNVARVGDNQQLTIDLLTAVTQRETLTVFLYRRQDLGRSVTDGANQAIGVPSLKVPDAMVQRGQITVRRSRLLDVRSGAMSGLSRIDTPDTHPLSGNQVDTSPVPLDNFQAFQFSQVPYSYQLSAQPSRPVVRVTGHTLVSLSQLDSSLESQLTLDIQQRSIYHLRLRLPDNWQLEPPSIPLPYEWTRAMADDQQTVDIYLASGATGTLPIILRGKLQQELVTGADGTVPSVQLPKIVVENVDQQTGDMVITSDPAYAVSAANLVNCETGLLDSAKSWLAVQHQPLAQVLIRYADATYSGQLNVSQRQSQVKAFSVSNIKLTDRSIEETLYFEFSIRTAGIRQLSIVVPAWLSGAKVRGPLIRNQTWTPLTADTDSPVRLQIELQEDVMGQYSLVIEHDRLLAGEDQQAPIPVIETGTTEHRFVTLENSGRDELVIDRTVGLDRLQRSQSQWNVLASLLGGKTTEAFVVNQSSADTAAAQLTYSTKDRSRVETVGARIGIAQTFMVVDENGVYRASQELRMENRTEQYLEIELPEGAQLWTATVAGEAVKPMTSAAGSQASSSTGLRIRLPLVKTAAGDLDYPVVIKYGGQVAKPGAWRAMRFPLVRTININVELSQVRLRLPSIMKWWNFGGSMSRVSSEDDLQAGWISFRTKQLMELTQLASQAASDDFSRARAINNLKTLGKEVQAFQSQSRTQSRTQSAQVQLDQSLASNYSAWFEAEKELNKPVDATRNLAESVNNRAILNDRVQSQSNGRSFNVANSVEENFGDIGQVVTNSGDSNFNAKWLDGNSLDNLADIKKAESTAGAMPQRVIVKGLQSRAKGKADVESKPQAAPEAKQQLQADKSIEVEGRASQVYRYQQRLEQNSVGNDSQLFLGRNAGAMGGMGMAAGESASQTPAFGAEVAQQVNNGMNGPMAPATPALPQAPAQPPVPGQLAAPTQTGGASGYLASLDMQLPIRGDEYFFTTPRGATEITVQSVSTKFINRVVAIVGLVVVGLVFVRVTRAKR